MLKYYKDKLYNWNNKLKNYKKLLKPKTPNNVFVSTIGKEKPSTKIRSIN